MSKRAARSANGADRSRDRRGAVGDAGLGTLGPDPLQHDPRCLCLGDVNGNLAHEVEHADDDVAEPVTRLHSADRLTSGVAAARLSRL